MTRSGPPKTRQTTTWARRKPATETDPRFAPLPDAASAPVAAEAKASSTTNLSVQPQGTASQSAAAKAFRRELARFERLKTQLADMNRLCQAHKINSGLILQPLLDQHRAFMREMVLTLDGWRHELKPGGYAYLPPGAAWTLRNESGAAVRFHWVRKAYEAVDGAKVDLLFALFAWGLARRWQGSTLARVSAVLVLLHGLGSLGTGWFPCDQGCAPVEPSFSQQLHNLSGLLMFLSLTLATALWAWLGDPICARSPASAAGSGS